MRKRIVFFVLAAAAVLSSCNLTSTAGDNMLLDNMVVLFNSAGEDKPLDIIEFNETEMLKSDISMSTANSQPPYGALKGIMIGLNGMAYLLTSSVDALVSVDLNRFKVMEPDLLNKLASPEALTLKGSQVFILNNGDSKTLPYISIYDVLGANYVFYYKSNIKCEEGRGGNAIYVYGGYCYVGGEKGIDVYELASGQYYKSVETPAPVLDILADGGDTFVVSLKDTGVALYDITIDDFTHKVGFPIGDDGVLAFGLDQEVLAYSSSEVYSVNLSEENCTVIYKGTDISGVERSNATRYLYVADKGGTEHIIQDVSGNIVGKFDSPAGNYTYLFIQKTKGE